MQIIDNLLPENQYYKEICDKTQIVLHHTVSNPISVKGDKDYWMSDISKIATYAIIDYNGIVNRMFPSDMWAHHLGVKAINLKALNFKDYSTRNILLNQNSIGIEIDNWGGLVKKEGLYYNCYGTPISKDLEVVECHWRGYKYYQKYSDAQINTLKEIFISNKVEAIFFSDLNRARETSEIINESLKLPLYYSKNFRGLNM